MATQTNADFCIAIKNSMNYMQKIGGFGEMLAKNYLIKHGYKIIETNVKTSYQEIDIIAKKGKFTIFVEVKTRTSFALGSADTALTVKKIKNYKKVINSYMYDNNFDKRYFRMDLISIDINKKDNKATIKHYKDIF